MWEGENRQRSLRAAYVRRGVSAKTAASIVSCAQHPLQQSLHVPYHTEICKVLYSLTRWRGTVLLLYFLYPAADLPRRNRESPSFLSPSPVPCPRLLPISHPSQPQLPFSLSLAGRDSAEIRLWPEQTVRTEAGGTEPWPCQVTRPAGSSGRRRGRGAEWAGREVRQILLLASSGKQRMTGKKPLRFLCWIFLHPRGCSNLLLVGQGPRSCMADGERVPWPLVFPLDHWAHGGQHSVEGGKDSCAAQNTAWEGQQQAVEEREEKPHIIQGQWFVWGFLMFHSMKAKLFQSVWPQSFWLCYTSHKIFTLLNCIARISLASFLWSDILELSFCCWKSLHHIP